MEYTIYKLYFKTAVHFGRGSLIDGEPVFYADTFFSALCHEAIKMGGVPCLEQVYILFKSGKLLLSDGMPFCKETLYIPKPLLPVENRNMGDSAEKKIFKKLKYIPANKIEPYLSGDLEARKVLDNLKNLGQYHLCSKAAISGLDESMPYTVGAYRFQQENGIYLFLGYMDENDLILFEDLLLALSFAGIGGKVSAGLGKFEFSMVSVPESLKKRFNTVGYKNKMSLSCCLPLEDELERALENARYIVTKRSGFVFSENYAPEMQKKKELYVFQAGSCFYNSFQGDIFDVSSNGTHPVYRYAKTLLMGVV